MRIGPVSFPQFPASAKSDPYDLDVSVNPGGEKITRADSEAYTCTATGSYGDSCGGSCGCTATGSYGDTCRC